MESARVTLDVCLEESEAASWMIEEVREGLRADPKRLPSKYFYDARGSRLFEEITRLPEYYVTRAEDALIERVADEVARRARPVDLVELGPGYAGKTRRLIEACRAQGSLRRYVPLEVSRGAAENAVRRLVAEFPWLEIHVVVGDFVRHLDRIPTDHRRLIAFLGGTIGNFLRPRAEEFLGEIGRVLGRDGWLLLGTDLVKDPAVLRAAYNDSRGVTAAFNRNILLVLNERLSGDFDPEGFEHEAFYDAGHARIEMHLRSLREQTVTLREPDLTVRFREGETIRTEVSCKYTRESVQSILEAAGLVLAGWYTDGPFALSLSRPA